MDNVVYIKHFENGKKYVGITNNFKRRMIEHNNPRDRYKHLPICKAMNKHEHYTEIVFESELYEDVVDMEKIVIKNFKDLGIELYNITEGGGGMLGYRHSEEIKQRLREANLGENNPMYGKTLSEETKRKLSIALSGENNPNYGKTLSEEAKKRISEANSGENNFWYGKKMSEETKRKMRENHHDNSGENSGRANSKEHYATNTARRDKFKRTCERMNWNYLDFDEIESDETYISPKGRVAKKYFYIYKGEGYNRDVDWNTTNNRPKEYYETTAVFRSSFKDKCEREGWDIGDFEEILVEYYYFPNNENRKIGKYFYKYIGGDSNE